MSLTGSPNLRVVSAPWWAVVLGAFCYVALAYAAARWNASCGLRRLMRSGGGGALGFRPIAAAMATQIYLVAALAGLMLAGGARLINETLHLERAPLASEAAAVAPFIAALLAYWWASYPLDRALRDRNRQALAMSGGPTLSVWTRRQFMLFNIRHNLLFVAVPVGLIILVLDVLDLIGPALNPTVAVAAGLTVVGTIIVSAPAIIVRIWQTGSLPAGPLRARLDRLCRRAGFACRDILIWNTDGVVVNAAVLGMARPVRYVLLSDAMLEHFDDEAVTAIFAHEAGHIVHHHIPYLILFSVGLFLLCGSAVELAAIRLDLPATVVELFMLVVTAILILWVVLFGMLSRRFERQADVFAASMAPADSAEATDLDDPEPEAELTGEGVNLFSESLLKVGRLNGIDPSRWNFRHGSISHRLKYLQRLLYTGGGRAETDRSIRRIKLAIWALLVLGIGVTVILVFFRHGIE